jgi:hypothetical protein
MLTERGGIAEFERALKHEQAKFKLSPHQIEEIRRRREAAESGRFLALRQAPLTRVAL